MNIARPATILAFLLLFIVDHASAQYAKVAFPELAQTRRKAKECMTNKTLPSGNAQLKPTGLGQRLVRTKNETGQPGGPMVATNELLYYYSGAKGSEMNTHGMAPYSKYDTAHSTLNSSYGYQRFYNQGNLKRSFYFSDNSAWSIPGAYQAHTYDYDEQGRLILDSFKQSDQPGANLDQKNRYAFDNQGRLIYAEYTINGYDPGGYDYSMASWKQYMGNDTLPQKDSVILVEDNVTTITVVKHFYDNNHQLIADSTYLQTMLNTPLSEVTLYTYPEPRKQVGYTKKRQNNTWIPLTNVVQTKDMLGRETFFQMELFENGQWQKLVKYEKQFTYDSQPDSLPTSILHYNDNNGSWITFYKEVRTFNADLFVDTLYTYAGSDGTINAATIPCFTVFLYNNYGFLSRRYTHNFWENGMEVNGYYTDYFYEDYEDPLAIKNKDKKDAGFRLYPNPATNLLNIRLNESATAGNTRIDIMDQLGRKKCSKIFHDRDTTIELSDLNAGLYYIRITDEKGYSSVRSMVKK